MDVLEFLVEAVLDPGRIGTRNQKSESPQAGRPHAHEQRVFSVTAKGQICEPLTDSRSPGQPIEIHGAQYICAERFQRLTARSRRDEHPKEEQAARNALSQRITATRSFLATRPSTLTRVK